MRRQWLLGVAVGFRASGSHAALRTLFMVLIDLRPTIPKGAALATRQAAAESRRGCTRVVQGAKTNGGSTHRYSTQRTVLGTGIDTVPVFHLIRIPYSTIIYR